MGDGHVFKVPSVKKKPPSLYCKETLDGLDDLRRRPNSKPTSHKTPAPCLTRNDTNGVTLTGGLTPNLSSLSDAALDTPNKIIVNTNENTKREGSCAPHCHSKYAIGLLNEFKGSANNYSQPLHQATQGSNATASASSVAQNSSYSQKFVPGVCSSDEDDDMTMSPDVLILRDESMANADSDSSGSDIDWDSLTPPAPRSPGDHTVPDLYDLESITTPSNCLIYSYDYLVSTQQAVSQRFHTTLADSGTNSIHIPPTQSSRQLSMSSYDHIVPDFYI